MGTLILSALPIRSSIDPLGGVGQSQPFRQCLCSFVGIIFYSQALAYVISNCFALQNFN